VEFGPQHEALSIAKYQTGRTNCKPSGFWKSNKKLNKVKKSMLLAEVLHDEHPHITLICCEGVFA
jgi:hypothetical protein